MLTLKKEIYDLPRQHIKKQKHDFAIKGLSSQGYVFPVIMYGYENWTIKKAESWRIDASELWYWRRLLRVPWTTRRSNECILKETSTECSLEGQILKLKLQYCGYLMWRTDSFEKTLMLGKIQGKKRKDDRGWDGWMASPTQWTWVWVRSGSWWWTGRPGMLQSMGLPLYLTVFSGLLDEFNKLENLELTQFNQLSSECIPRGFIPFHLTCRKPASVRFYSLLKPGDSLTLLFYKTLIQV